MTRVDASGTATNDGTVGKFFGQGRFCKIIAISFFIFKVHRLATVRAPVAKTTRTGFLEWTSMFAVSRMTACLNHKKDGKGKNGHR